MNISLTLFLIVSGSNVICLNKKINSIFYVALSLLVLSLLIAICNGNNLSYSFRFFLILILIVQAYYIEPNEKYIKIFLKLILIQALVIIFLEIYFKINYSIQNYSSVRFLFQKKGWGDIYTYDNEIWKIQIKGNALLPFGLFLSYFVTAQALKK